MSTLSSGFHPDFKWKNETWLGVFQLVLAVFLLMSPWIFGFASVIAAGRNAWICGAALSLASLWAIFTYTEWEEWISLLLGLWVIVSPWLLGFHNAVMAATRVDVVSGVAIMVFASIELWLLGRASPHVTA
jgi:hypothetical protein